MEINPGGVIFAVLIIGVIASLLLIGLLILLDALKILRFHEKSGIVAYGIIGGIVFTILFFTSDPGCHKKGAERISIESDNKTR